jgi:type IV pilus assembly protein PilY1
LVIPTASHVKAFDVLEAAVRSVAWLLLSVVAVEAPGQDRAPLAMAHASARVEYDDSASGTGRSTAIFFEPADTGALGARDEATGRELWTFFPPELGQARTSGDLMTQIAVLRFDANRDGVIDTARGDRVWLYFGLKRGGPWYYALDVTGRAPRVLWKAGSSQLEGLGEAWSAPTIARVRIAGTRQDPQHFVVIVGGGFSPDSSATGNRILMLDAATGRLLWSAGNHAAADRPLSRMGHGIAARIAVLDTDGDEFADRMYAADIGGQVWRFDIWNGRDRSELVTGGVLANLGAAEPRPMPATAADARRFFNAPDVTLIQPRGGNAYYNLAIGSGDGGSATATSVTDRFYSIRDRQPFTRRAQSEYNALQPMFDSDLIDITPNPVGFRVPDYALGWRLDLASGEEVLAESLTANGVVLFTTFKAAASGGTADCCTASCANRVYAVRADSGTAAIDLNRDVVVTPEDRSSLLSESTCRSQPGWHP